jgi:hypothetical protein
MVFSMHQAATCISCFFFLSAVESFDEKGEKLAFNQSAVFVQQAGGFGGKRSTDKAVMPHKPPSRAPDASMSEKTSIDQVRELLVSCGAHQLSCMYCCCRLLSTASAEIATLCILTPVLQLSEVGRKCSVVWLSLANLHCRILTANLAWVMFFRLCCSPRPDQVLR